MICVVVAVALLVCQATTVHGGACENKEVQRVPFYCLKVLCRFSGHHPKLTITLTGRRPFTSTPSSQTYTQHL